MTETCSRRDKKPGRKEKGFGFDRFGGSPFPAPTAKQPAGARSPDLPITRVQVPMSEPMASRSICELD